MSRNLVRADDYGLVTCDGRSWWIARSETNFQMVKDSVVSPV